MFYRAKEEIAYFAKRVQIKFTNGRRWFRQHCPYMEFLWGVLGLLAIIGLPLAALYGYVANIVTLYYLPVLMSGEGAIRIIGVFLPPIGWFAGYF